MSFVFTNGLVMVNAATSFTGAESLEFRGTGGNDSVTAGGLSDAVYGNNGNDTLRGGAGNDVLDDGAGNDKMFGDAGNDLLIRSAALGTDIIDGGEGVDTLSFSLDAARSVILDLSNNANNDGAAKYLVVAGVEIVHGSNMDDDVRGTTANETFLGGDGDDFLSGGAGDDIYVVDNAGDKVTEAAGAGTDEVQASVSFTLSANVENLTLTGSSNLLGTGKTLANTIAGDAGNNVLNGGAGAARLVGG
ncbi:calcium-binding protein, partial [Rhizobiaceae sp. 2RAB30]